jgi:hypothetical protein
LELKKPLTVYPSVDNIRYAIHRDRVKHKHLVKPGVQNSSQAEEYHYHDYRPDRREGNIPNPLGGAYPLHQGGFKEGRIDADKSGQKDYGAPAHLFPGIGKNDNPGKGFGIGQKSHRFPPEGLDYIVNDPVPGGEEGEENTVHDNPREKMGKVGQGLNQFGEFRPDTFVDPHRQKYSRGNTHQKFSKAVKEGVPKKLPKIKGLKKSIKMFKPYPAAPKHPVQGHKVPKGDLPVPDREVFKDDIIDNGNNKENIYRPMPPDLLNHMFVYGTCPFIFHALLTPYMGKIGKYRQILGLFRYFREKIFVDFSHNAILN